MAPISTSGWLWCDLYDDTGNGMVTNLTIRENSATRAELVATIREPVIAEPLNYSSGTNYGNCMWSVSNLELNLQFGSLYRMICMANNTCKLSDE